MKIIYLFSKKIRSKIIAYAIGSYFMSLAIPLLVSPGIGLSGPDSYITSICRALHYDPTTAVYGYIIWVHYGVLWSFVAIIFFIKKKVKKEKVKKYDYFYIFSMLVPVFLTGPLVSLNNLWVPNLVNGVNFLWLKYVIFLSGIIISTLGSSLVVWSNMLIEPHSAIVLEANEIMHIKVFLGRIILDSLFFIMAISIGYSSDQNVINLNEISRNTNANTGPLISYSTIIFLATNGIFFGLFIKLWKRILGENK